MSGKGQGQINTVLTQPQVAAQTGISTWLLVVTQALETNADPGCHRTMDPHILTPGWQHGPQTSKWSQLASQTIYTYSLWWQIKPHTVINPSSRRTTDPDMAFSGSWNQDITMASGVSTDHADQFASTMPLPHVSMASGHQHGLRQEPWPLTSAWPLMSIWSTAISHRPQLL